MASLASHDAPRTEICTDALMDPHRAYREGRAAIERLDRAGVRQAREATRADRAPLARWARQRER